MGRRSRYPEECRQRAAQLVLDSRRSVREVAAELRVNHETLRNWVAAERRQRAEGPAALSADERWSWPGCGARSRSWNSSGRS